MSYLRTAAVLILLFYFASFVFAQGPAIEIEILKPDSSAVYEKGQDIEVEAKVIFPEGSSGQNVEARMPTERGIDEKVALEKNASGNYYGVMRTSYETHSNVHMVVVASANIGEKHVMEFREVPLEIESAEISLDFFLFPEAPYYFGDVIEEVRIDAFYPDGSRVPLKNFERPFLVIDGKRNTLDLEEDENSALVADIEYSFELSEEFLMGPGRGIMVELMNMMDDKYGNIAGDVRKDIEISKEHPLLGIKIKNPRNHTMLPQGKELDFEIELTKGLGVVNEEVFLIDSRDLSNSRQCQRANGEGETIIFKCTETIPTMDEVTWIYYVALAKADIADRKVTVCDVSENDVGEEGDFPPSDGNGWVVDGGDFEPFNPMLFVGLIVAVFAVFVFIMWFLVLRKKKTETIEELKEEADTLREFLKRIEIDYFKRKLSEEEYKKRYLEYQTKLGQITAKLKIKGSMKEEKQRQKK